jgi:hypothetical protein
VIISLQPVTFAVALNDTAGTGFIPCTTLATGLEVSESFRLIWPDDGGVKATMLVALQFAVVG